RDLMASIFKPCYTVASKDDPTKRERRTSRRWWIEFRDCDGKRRRVKAYHDRRASEALAAELERTAARIAAGLLPRGADRPPRPLDHQAAECRKHLEAWGATAKCRREAARMVSRFLDSARCDTLGGFTPAAVEAHLAALEGQGGRPASARSRNYHLTILRR